MTKVLVSIKIFPSDTTTDMNILKDKVRKTLEGKASIYKYEEEPVAFGLVALIAHVLVPEEAQLNRKKFPSLGDNGPKIYASER